MKTEPAFPCLEEVSPSESTYHLGMSKRYWTAVMITQGLSANSGLSCLTTPSLVETAFEITDELLRKE